jgi:hypothetical protein
MNESKLIDLLIKKKAKDELLKNKEIVICAAVLGKDGKPYRGHRHSDCFRTIRDSKQEIDLTQEAQGFITSWNRYVTREEGRAIQDAAGIPSASPEGYMPGTLFSEDLY